MVFQAEINLPSRGRGFTELTAKIQALVRESGVWAGLCSVFLRHTSASLVVTENADPVVLGDLERFMSRLVVDGDLLFQHRAEGADDMPAHVRSVLTRTDITMPVRAGSLVLGTWQGLYLWEHRSREHERVLTVTIVGDARSAADE